MTQNKNMFENLFGVQDTGSQEEQQVIDITPEEHVSVDSLTPEAFRDMFKRPKAGSLIYKLKKGEARGKHASKMIEDSIVELLLVSRTEVPFKYYMIGRMVMGHSNSMDFAESCKKTMISANLNEEQLLPHLFGPKVRAWSDLGPFLQSLLPYHKDIIMNHVGLFSRLQGINK